MAEDAKQEGAGPHTSPAKTAGRKPQAARKSKQVATEAGADGGTQLAAQNTKPSKGQGQNKKAGAQGEKGQTQGRRKAPKRPLLEEDMEEEDLEELQQQEQAQQQESGDAPGGEVMDLEGSEVADAAVADEQDDEVLPLNQMAAEPSADASDVDVAGPAGRPPLPPGVRAQAKEASNGSREGSEDAEGVQMSKGNVAGVGVKRQKKGVADAAVKKLRLVSEAQIVAQGLPLQMEGDQSTVKGVGPDGKELDVGRLLRAVSQLIM